MPLDLRPGERDFLVKLTRGRSPRPSKPTRKQTAIALLGLAEGLSHADAAARAGTSVEAARSIAAAFAEGGLAAFGMIPEPPEMEINIVRPGFGSQKFLMAVGSTVATLLDNVGAEADSQTLVVNGEIADRSTPLTDHAVVHIVPPIRNPASEPSRTGGASRSRPWHATVPALRDENLHRAFLGAVESRREADRADEDRPG